MVVDPQSILTLCVLFFFRGVKLCAEKYPHKIGGAGGVRHPHFRRIKNILLVTFLLQLIALFSRPPHISRFFYFSLNLTYILYNNFFKISRWWGFQLWEGCSFFYSHFYLEIIVKLISFTAFVTTLVHCKLLWIVQPQIQVLLLWLRSFNEFSLSTLYIYYNKIFFNCQKFLLYLGWGAGIEPTMPGPQPGVLPLN